MQPDAEAEFARSLIRVSVSGRMRAGRLPQPCASRRMKAPCSDRRGRSVVLLPCPCHTEPLKTTIDPAGQCEIVDFAPGDVWYFPRGHGHSIQGLGPGTCVFLLVFDNGYFSEFGTFSIVFDKPGKHTVEVVDVVPADMKTPAGYGTGQRLGQFMDPSNPTRPSAGRKFRFRGWTGPALESNEDRIAREESRCASW